MRYRLTTLLALPALLIVPGCSTNDADTPANPAPNDSSTSQFGDFVDTHKEFQAFAESATWPDGFTVTPPEDPGEVENPDGTKARPVFEIGYGTGTAHNYWICAWQIDLLKNAENNTDISEAVTHLRTFNQSPEAALYADQSTLDYYTDTLDSAELGDLAAMKEDVKFNCDQTVKDGLNWED